MLDNGSLWVTFFMSQFDMGYRRFTGRSLLQARNAAGDKYK
jgi:hypothetical protein